MGEYVGKEAIEKRLAISHDTIDRLIARGEIVAVKIGKAVRIELESVERYLQEHQMGKQPEA